MSGHSKWSTIKRQKGLEDARRGQIFTKLSNAITLAVKQGAGETRPESNFKLRLAMDRARASNMPRENIERAIARAGGSGAGAVEEVLYEGFAPCGVAIIIEAATDNKQRTISEVKNIFERNGGVLGAPGGVSYLFKKRGEIVTHKNKDTSEDLLAKGINAGAEDMEEEGGFVFFYSHPQNLKMVRDNLAKQGLQIESAKIVFLPLSYVKPDQEFQNKIASLVSDLEELSDVQEVYTNLEQK